MAKWSGAIGNTGILDLTWVKSADELSEVTSIDNVGIVRVSESLYNSAISIPQHNVGLIQMAATGSRQAMTGSLRVTGDFLAHGAPDTILDITGCLLVLPPVNEIGFKGICVNGILAMPRGSEGMLSSKLGNVTGVVAFYPADKGTPRVIEGDESIGREFLELLPEATPLIVAGHLTLENDITAELLRSKVCEITLSGDLTTPRALLPLVQFLAAERSGSIQVADQQAAPTGSSAEPE
jgi:hypothetical protein